MHPKTVGTFPFISYLRIRIHGPNKNADQDHQNGGLPWFYDCQLDLLPLFTRCRVTIPAGVTQSVTVGARQGPYITELARKKPNFQKN